MKKALVTGITGQDGSYLTELLLKKGSRLGTSSAKLSRSTPAESTICIKTPTKNPVFALFTATSLTAATAYPQSLTKSSRMKFTALGTATSRSVST